MREEVEHIERLLSTNGWTLSTPAKEGEMSEYVKNYNNGENVIGIEIALEPESLGCYGYYGVGCIQIVKYESGMPYIRDDIERMKELILEAEKDLVKVGIPFRPTYGFGSGLEYRLGENLRTRERYRLDELEKEDMGVALT